jgi:hypothetical protein
MTAIRRPLVITIVTLGVLDLAGLIAVIANPDLVPRMIPALAAIQIIGFAALFVVYFSRAQWPGDPSGSSTQKQYSREAGILLLRGVGAMLLLVALLDGAAAPLNKIWITVLRPVAGSALSFYIAHRIRKNSNNPGARV